MNKETLRMQMLAGIITESQYKQKLNEINDEGIIDVIEEFGWYFDDGILGGVGSGGAGYYDAISDEISGYDLNEFNEEAFNKWYDTFNMESFNTVELNAAEDEDEEYDFGVLEGKDGIYHLEDANGYAKIENNGSDLTLYAQPMLSSDDEEEFLPIFGISKNGEIEKLMSKEEVASKLKENLTSPGKWAIL
jgi:hypothetical protein